MLTDAQRAALISRVRGSRDPVLPGIGKRPQGADSAPMSFGQEQLWFIDRLAPGGAAYNIPLAVRVSGPLDVPAACRAVTGLVARHEALRTRLVTDPDGRPVQVVDPPPASVLSVTDLSGLPPGRRQDRLAEFIAAQSLRPFDLAAGPLLRAWLLVLSPDEHILAIVVHHAVFDGWSVGVLVREVAALYGQEAAGHPAGLAELAAQFADYAVWERDRMAGTVLAELESYWRTVMADFPVVQFPADRPRPLLDSFDGGLVTHTTDRTLLDGLRELSRREGTTLFVTLMAAMQALLCRYTGQADIVVGTVSANRARPELAPLIGFLVNTLPIRGDLSGDPPFTELLARVRGLTTGAYAHQDLPFAKMVETLQVQRDPSRTPVFQIAFSYAERDPVPVRAADVEFVLTDLVVGTDAAKFDLAFLAEARPGGLWFECSYKTALFDAVTVRRVLENLEVLLSGVLADPSARLSALPVLSAAELRRELTGWNDTAAPFPAGCVHEGFEAQVARTPGAVAASYEAEQISYADLNRQANQIARRLRDLRVGPEILVGVCMRAGLRRLAVLLGILKAGGGYIPLDPALPADRIAFMISDAAMPVIVTDSDGAASAPAASAPAASAPAAGQAAVLCLDQEWPAISALGDTNLGGDHAGDPRVGPANVAYVIYTSGSTGRPKGVMVEHRHAVNFLHGMIGAWQIGPSSAALQFATFTFDASVLDMFMPLLAGGKVVLAPAQTLHSPKRLATLIREAGVTFACLSPTVLSLLAEEDLPGLRVLLSGGEELPSELVRHWLRPGLRFVNAYGPTEATVVTTWQELDQTVQLPAPIGLPGPNYRAYVLDTYLNPVPVGVTGELHIGGASVARGYLNRPDLTEQRFIPDPFSPGQRLYKTGDLVRRRGDGSIVFAGRVDHQVKVRGLRIELGEIEAALASYPGVEQAVVTVGTDQAGEKQLVGYLRAGPGPGLDLAAVRAHLSRTLPGYLVPAHLITVAEFPLNASGKVDRAALPAPDLTAGTGELAAPVTQTEASIAGLYAAVLRRDHVGVTDSFFDIGGNSLQAMRLVDLVSEQTGADVGVTAVFLHPTPRQLAASIDAARDAEPTAGSSLLSLSAGAGDLPLVLIHPIGGTVFGYTQLAAELAATFRVYGLQAPGLAEPAAIAASLDDLVTDYTRQIRAALPDGPYRLAGWSMGGVIAFEITRRLEQAGAEVALLALLDAPYAIPAARRPGPDQLAADFLADAARSLGWDPDLLPDPATTTAAEQLAWLGRQLGAHDTATSTGRPGPGALGAHGTSQPSRDPGAGVTTQLVQRFDVFHAHTKMLAGYTATEPPVHAPTLIVSADGSANAPMNPNWQRVVAGPVSTLQVSSDHYDFLRFPLVADVATAIRGWHGGTGSTPRNGIRG